MYLQVSFMLMDIFGQTGFESFFHGVHHIRRESDGWLPLRFPEDQIDRFRQANEVWYPRILCPAGIRVVFLTAARHVSLEFRVSERIRDIGGPELFVDDRFVERKEISGSGPGRLVFEIPESAAGGPQRRVDIFLPWSFTMVLRSLEVEEAQPIQPPSGRYLALGDSITQGVFSTAPSSAYTAVLSRSLNLDLLNRGVGGHIFEVESLDDSIGRPELVTVAYGTNDWAQCVPRDVFRNRVSSYLERLEAIVEGAECHVITPLWREEEARPNESGDSLDLFRDIIAEVCDEQGIKCIDGSGLIPHSADFFADHVHPNDEGFREMAKGLLARIHSPA